MPTYGYECEKCNHEFETEQGYHDEPLKKCPKCKRQSLVRKIYCPIAIMTGPKTIGYQAEANTRAIGRDELSEREARKAEKIKDLDKKGKLPKGAKPLLTKPKTPWWRTGEIPGTVKSKKPLTEKQAVEILKATPELQPDRTTDGRTRKRSS